MRRDTADLRDHMSETGDKRVARSLAVRIEGLTKSFDGHRVVDDLSLEIAAGEVLVLLGPSGCGKTTTLRVVAGLEKPDAGRVFIGDERVDTLPPKDRDVAMVFQDYALYPHMSVMQNIGFPLRIRSDLTKAEIRDHARRAGELVGLEDLLGRRPQQLSGGEQQRVALARAFVREPRVFLMDEPLANLDAKLKMEMRAELQVLHRRLGVTTLVVSHDQLDAMTLGSRIAIMEAGRLRQVGTPEEVYGRPADRFVAGFLGTPAMNFLPGKVAGLNPTQVTLEGLAASCPGPAGTGDGLSPGTGVVVGVRPEKVQIADASCAWSVPGRVFVLEPVGSDTYAYLKLANGSQVVIRTAPKFRPAIDEVVPLTWEGTDVHLFDSTSGLRLG